jgi:hypothetical protein
MAYTKTLYADIDGRTGTPGPGFGGGATPGGMGRTPGFGATPAWRPGSVFCVGVCVRVRVRVRVRVCVRVRVRVRVRVFVCVWGGGGRLFK